MQASLNLNEKPGRFGALVPENAAGVRGSLQKMQVKLQSKALFDRSIVATAYAAQAVFFSLLNVLAYPAKGLINREKFREICLNTSKSIAFTAIGVVCVAAALLYPGALKLLTVVSKDFEYVKFTFPEFIGRSFNIIDLRFKDCNAVCGKGSTLKQVLDEAGYAKFLALKSTLPKNPRVLSLIDLQNDFLNGGSLMVPGAQEKVLKALEEMLSAHQRSSLFDVIVMTKDFHPKGHKSFTQTYFNVEETEFRGKKSFILKPNEDGRKLGVKMRDFWKTLPHIASKIECFDRYDGATIITPKYWGNYETVKNELLSGQLMPMTTGLHPIPVTPHMFDKAVSVDQQLYVVDKLKELGLLNDDNTINGSFEVRGTTFAHAFAASHSPIFDTHFVKLVADYLKMSTEQTQEILGCLTEDFWPNHCVQGDKGHQFHEKLVFLLELYAAKVPIVPLPKGNALNSGESYSAGLNTAGYLASPNLPFLVELEPKYNIVCGTATGYCPSGTALDSKEFLVPTLYWEGASKGILPADEAAAHKEMSEKGINVVANYKDLKLVPTTSWWGAAPGVAPSVPSVPRVPAPSSSSSSSGVSSSSSSKSYSSYGSVSSVFKTIFGGRKTEHLIVKDYFDKLDKINSQAQVTNLTANILVGPATPGFMDKIPMPYCAVTLENDTVAKRVNIFEDSTWILTGGDLFPGKPFKGFDFDQYKILNKAHYKKTGLELTFSSHTSNLGTLNMSDEEKESNNIDSKAKYFTFIYPIDALSGGLAYEARKAVKKMGLSVTPERVNDKLRSFVSDIIDTLKDQYGDEFAALMYLGGYAYFDESMELVQTKALVGNMTPDVMPLKKARKSSELPAELKEEFDASVIQFTSDANSPRDGRCVPVTSPELLGYGATHFSYVPPGYIPEAAQEKIARGDKKIEALYNTFWKEKAKEGLFLYKFKEERHDCYLALGQDPAAPVDEALAATEGNVVISKDGRPQKVKAFIEDECVIGRCSDSSGANAAKPNVVWLTENPKTKAETYRLVCCSECNRGMSDPTRKRMYGEEVIEQYDVSVKTEVLHDQFFESFHAKQITNYNAANLNEMCASKRYPVDMYSSSSAANIPYGAAHFEYLYPAEKLALTTDDPQVKALYQYGGFAYYDRYGRLVGINELKLGSEEGTRELKFEALEEIALSDSLRDQFKAAINDEQLPVITLKALRAKGVRYFMWVPPKDAKLPSEKGMFLYFTADGSSAFAKRVK